MQIDKNREAYDLWKRNTIVASEELYWENEEKILVNFMHNLA